MNPQVSIVRCASYEPSLVREAVKNAVGLIGGITAFIKPQSTVLVKPNLLMPKGPEYGIDTHPEVVRSVIRLLKEIGCTVYLGDSPSAISREENIEDLVYAESGIAEVARLEGAELVKFDKRKWHGKFPLTAWLEKCDYFVSVPKFKTHQLLTLTGAIKNLFGLVCGAYKTQLHIRHFDNADFARILVDVLEEAKPDLTVIDGIVAMEGDGPGTSGTLRQAGLVFAGADCVALDSVLAAIMGLEPEDILTTKEAASRMLGVSDLSRISILGEGLDKAKAAPFKLPQSSALRKLPRPLIDLARKLIKYYPCLKQSACIRCGSCVEVCPNKAVSLKKSGAVFDYRKCISCFCCQESCPAGAIRVKRSLLAKLTGL